MTAGMNSREEQNLDNSKETIKKIAYKLFQEKGYNNVSLKEIFAAAEISKTTFYYHFNSKEDLLEDFTIQPEPLSLDAVNIVFSMDSYWEQLWYLTYVTCVKIMEIGPSIYKQVFQLNIENNKGTFDLLNYKTASVFFPMIKKGQETGVFKNQTPAEILIQMAWTMYTGILAQWCINDGDFNLAERVMNLFQNIYQVDEKYHFSLESFLKKYSL